MEGISTASAPDSEAYRPCASSREETLPGGVVVRSTLKLMGDDGGGDEGALPSADLKEGDCSSSTRDGSSKRRIVHCVETFGHTGRSNAQHTDDSSPSKTAGRPSKSWDSLAAHLEVVHMRLNAALNSLSAAQAAADCTAAGRGGGAEGGASTPKGGGEQRKTGRR